MPTYELVCLSRVLPRQDLVTVLKRIANAIFDKNGIIRKIENLGCRSTPYKISNHGAVHREANYFIIEFDAPPSKLDNLKEEYERDVDIVRSKIFKVPNTEATFECTLEEEMKPPPYRSEVIKMIEDSKKKEARRPRFKYNSGLDYYPFQK